MKGNGLLILAVSRELTGTARKEFKFDYYNFIMTILFILFYSSTLTTEVTPSFILLAIQGSKVVTYVYELDGDKVEVTKSEFSKA